MQHKSLIEQHMNWCVHYAGLLGPGLKHIERCKAGVAYEDVKIEGKGLSTYPCFADSNLAGRCPSCRFPTLAEAQEHEREVNDHIAQWAAKLEADVCPHCDTAITRYQKVGRCVYADPCGHRLYQGDVPKGKPSTTTRLNDGWEDV